MRLNSGKTRILTAQAAAKHFFVSDNTFLDEKEKIIEKRKKGLGVNFVKSSVSKQISSISKKFHSKLKVKNYYSNGNGEKVLKRHFSFALK